MHPFDDLETSGFGSPSTEAHRQDAPSSVRAAVLTISDTRTREEDRSGELIRQNLTWRGHDIAAYRIVQDDPDQIGRHSKAGSPIPRLPRSLPMVVPVSLVETTPSTPSVACWKKAGRVW
jgi:hypothetical protein